MIRHLARSTGALAMLLALLACPTEPRPRPTPGGSTSGSGAGTGGSGTGGGTTSGGGTTTSGPGDFTLTVDPASVRVPTGGSSTITVTARRSGGFVGEIALGVSGLPARMTATSAVISPLGSTATITLSAGITSDFTPGSCRVWGQAAGIPQRNALFSCGFTTGAPVQGFTMSVSPTTLTMGKSGTATLSLSVSRRNGYIGTAFFTVSGLPSGASWDTRGIPYNSTTGTLSIFTGSTTPAGTYRITIKGSTGTTQYSADEKDVILTVR